MLFLYFVYGLSFIILAVSLFLQARIKAGPLPNRAIWLLSAFAGLHGASEWISVARLARARLGLHVPLSLVISGKALLILSFFFLFAFGGEILAEQKQRPRKWLAFETGYFGSFLIVAIAFLLLQSTVSLHDRLHIVESFTRYALGFPAAILSATALYLSGRKHDRIYGTRLGPSLLWSGGVLLIYAVAAGLLQPGIPVREPLRIFHFEAVWVIGLRTFCAIALTGLLAEAFIVEISKYLREADRLREEFIGTVTHDIRSSISGAASAAELLQRVAGTGDRARLTALSELIRRNLDNANATINDLFETSVFETGRLPMHASLFDLRPLLDQLIEEMRLTELDRSFRLENGPESLLVSADRRRVEQALRNLLSNAVKYSPVGSEVQLNLAAKGRLAQISITNAGPGIPQNEIPLVFERFYRTRGAAPTSGTGIGLYIVKQLVEANGGEVSVVSRPNETTTFTISFPRSAR